MNLRPYQTDCYHAARAALLRGLKRIVLSLCTGAGKTIIFSMIARDAVKKGGKVLVLVNRDNLCSQAAEKLGKICSELPDMEKAERRGSRLSSVVVGSVQTMQGKRLKEWNANHFALVIVDECHGLASKQFKAICNHFKDAYWVGVTATPDRSDGKGIFFFFQEIAYELPLVTRSDVTITVGDSVKRFANQSDAEKFLDRMSEKDIIRAKIGEDVIEGAINLGWLSPIKIRSLPVPLEIDEKTAHSKELTEEEEARVISPHLWKLANAMKKEIGAMKTLCFLPDCESSMAFAQMLRNIGIKAAHVEGVGSRKVFEKDDEGKIVKDANGEGVVKLTRKFTRAEYDEVYEKFKTGEIQVVCNSQIWYIGFDMPDIECVAPLRLIKSTTMFRQIVGRGTRVVANVDACETAEQRKAAIAASRKPFMLLLDLMIQCEDHDFASPSLLISNEGDDVKRKPTKPQQFVSDDVEMMGEKARKKTVGDLNEKLKRMAELVAERASMQKKKREIFIHDIIQRPVAIDSVTASEKQIGYLKFLLRQTGVNLPDGMMPETMSKGKASALISRLLSRQKKMQKQVA
jgi:superfamily II DNA or RNA helicase